MKAYLVGAVLAVGVAAILSLLTPEGRGRRTYHLLLSLTLLLVLTAPLAVRGGCNLTTLPGGDDGGGTVTAPEGGQLLLDATAAALREEIAAHFSLPPEDIGVTVGGRVSDAGDVTLRRVTVVLFRESRVKRLEVKMYLEETIKSCEVTVYVE